MCWGIWGDMKGKMEDTYDNISLCTYMIFSRIKNHFNTK